MTLRAGTGFQLKTVPLLFGMATFIPGVNRFRAKGTGGTDSARYCYSVWLRHLVMARNNGIDPYPKTVAELGPGDSLGIGLAALISGCEKYYAFDVVEHANIESNRKVFDELVALFRNRENIPGPDEFPEVKPCLETYEFPGDILDDVRLRHVLENSRVERIKRSIGKIRQKDSPIEYVVPWNDSKILKNESVDMIYSQAVLEHVDDLEGAYKAMRLWIKPNGFVSHQIDFRCHGTTREWNGHWACSDFMWKMIRGKRPYLLNREPHSTHIAMLKRNGFRIACDCSMKSASNLAIKDLSERFQSISVDDVTTSGSFIQAVRRE